MITFDKSFVTIGEDQVVPKKVNAFIIYFNTPSKGQIEAWLEAVLIQDETITEAQNRILPLSFLDTYFTGKDLLLELHNEFKSKLEELNPEIKFVVSI